VDASAKVALLEPEGSEAGNAIVVEQIRQRGHRQARLRHRDPGREKPAFAGEENAAANHRQPACACCARRREPAARPGGLSSKTGQFKDVRAVGGMRASIYDAMPIGGVRRLVEYTREFEAKRG